MRDISFDVLQRAVVAGGSAFGEVGANERPDARADVRARVRVDPAAPRNKVTTDIALAPRDSDGLISARLGRMAPRRVDWLACMTPDNGVVVQR